MKSIKHMEEKETMEYFSKITEEYGVHVPITHFQEQIALLDKHTMNLNERLYQLYDDLLFVKDLSEKEYYIMLMCIELKLDYLNLNIVHRMALENLADEMMGNDLINEEWLLTFTEYIVDKDKHVEMIEKMKD